MRQDRAVLRTSGVLQTTGVRHATDCDGVHDRADGMGRSASVAAHAATATAGPTATEAAGYSATPSLASGEQINGTDP